MNQLSKTFTTLSTALIVIGIITACTTPSIVMEDGVSAVKPQNIKIISIDGSSTVFPITEAVAEEFYIKTKRQSPVTVGVSGTGGGMKKFCRGETHISNASRPQTEKEIALCQESGLSSIELPIAIDGITVVVNKDNDFIDCLSVEQLNKIWNPSAEDKITMWNQIDSSWPAEKMELYGPGQDSGTFDYFTETVNGESQASRGDFTASEDDNVLITGVAGDKYALAYFGYAYYSENSSKLKAVEIVNEVGDCVFPDDKTINNGEYNPLSRPLFIYVRSDVADVEPIKTFVEFYLSPVGRELLGQVGYVAYPDNVYDLALERFTNINTECLWCSDNPKTGGVLERLKDNR